jgi:outer membrane lipoprotein-sorting protein
MRTLVFAALLMLLTGVASAQTGEEILRKMDENMTFDTRMGEVTMTIHDGNGNPDKKKLQIWGQGFDKSYSTFLEPSRDKGTRFLKLGENLYMVLPRSSKVVKIVGHMLRQGMMDSDFSFEDMMESRALFTDYNVEIMGDEDVEGNPCWIIELTEKEPGTTYPKRRLWIEKKSFVALRSERYAKSGALLKTMEQSRIQQFGNRYYPLRTVMRDVLKKKTHTVIEMDKLSFDVELPPKIFSRRALMKSR